MKRSAEYAKEKELRKKRNQGAGVITKFMPLSSKLKYNDIPTGTFTGSLVVEWHGPQKYVFFQHTSDETPFSFIRANGEVIQPERMITDAGSIPRILWTIPGFSPWEYGPAYIVHDWEFRLHMCGNSDKTFDEVNQTLLEGIKTLMETGICPPNVSVLRIIDYSIHSAPALKRWTAPTCPYTPEETPFTTM